MRKEGFGSFAEGVPPLISLVPVDMITKPNGLWPVTLLGMVIITSDVFCIHKNVSHSSIDTCVEASTLFLAFRPLLPNLFTHIISHMCIPQSCPNYFPFEFELNKWLVFRCIFSFTPVLNEVS